MTTTTVATLLDQHPTNPIKDTLLHSTSSKTWARSYPPITNINVRTLVQSNQAVLADFDNAFLPVYDDDQLRFAEQALAPNYRQWRLSSEEDGINWFHHEISNVVLAAWARYPGLLQTSHDRPLTDQPVSETVDISYSVAREGARHHVAIGEFKRNLIEPNQWQTGRLTTTQRTFSQELRGYAAKYACPQVFAFDHRTFLLLQFRAIDGTQISDANCQVDCWVLPRDNFSGTTLRYALYRLLVQGFRRCQSIWQADVFLYGIRPHHREFYNGRPVWEVDGNYYDSPWGHQRKLDASYGAFYWTDSQGLNAMLYENGERVWDTSGFWEF